MRVTTVLAIVICGLTGLSRASANIISVINFETVPVLAQGPSTFGGPAQVVTVPGIATISGGTVLGLATNFPAIIYATSPNVYGTDNAGIYSETLTISINPSDSVDEVSFPIFNGETSSVSYVATAFNGTTQVAQQTFTNVPANTSSGYALADLVAANITSVTITPVGAPSAYDFLIDTIALNESVQQAVNPTPEPSTFVLAGMAGVLAIWIQRCRKRSAILPE
jgi:hypothetical protein